MKRMKRSVSFSDLNSHEKRYDVGIVTAVKTEFEAIYNKMTQYGDIREYIKDEGTKAEKKFYCGKIKGQNCVLSTSGVGTEDATLCTERMINDFNVARVVNVGSAGTYAKSKVNILDFVISSKLVRSDIDLTIISGHKKGSYENGVEPHITANKRLVELASAAGNEMKEPYYIGTILTGNSFINDPTKKKETLKEFGALCDEMEGAAVARCCSDREIPFVVIRCITDKPMKEEVVMYYDNLSNAAKRCADMVERLSGLLTKEKNKDIIEKTKTDVNKINTRMIKNSKRLHHLER